MPRMNVRASVTLVLWRLQRQGKSLEAESPSSPNKIWQQPERVDGFGRERHPNNKY